VLDGARPEQRRADIASGETRAWTEVVLTRLVALMLLKHAGHRHGHHGHGKRESSRDVPAVSKFVLNSRSLVKRNLQQSSLQHWARDWRKRKICLLLLSGGMSGATLLPELAVGDLDALRAFLSAADDAPQITENEKEENGQRGEARRSLVTMQVLPSPELLGVVLTPVCHPTIRKHGRESRVT